MKIFFCFFALLFLVQCAGSDPAAVMNNKAEYQWQTDCYRIQSDGRQSAMSKVGFKNNQRFSWRRRFDDRNCGGTLDLPYISEVTVEFVSDLETPKGAKVYKVRGQYGIYYEASVIEGDVLYFSDESISESKYTSQSKFSFDRRRPYRRI